MAHTVTTTIQSGFKPHLEASSKTQNKDQRIQRMTQRAIDQACTIIPDEPYLLSLPEEEGNPYRVSRDFRDNWRIDGFFARHEEWLQYGTFLLRNSMESMLEQRAMHEFRSEKPETSTLKPPGDAAKVEGTGTIRRKMKLSDYKKQKADPERVKKIAETKVLAAKFTADAIARNAAWHAAKKEKEAAAKSEAANRVKGEAAISSQVNGDSGMDADDVEIPTIPQDVDIIMADETITPSKRVTAPTSEVGAPKEKVANVRSNTSTGSSKRRLEDSDSLHSPAKRLKMADNAVHVTRSDISQSEGGTKSVQPQLRSPAKIASSSGQTLNNNRLHPAAYPPTPPKTMPNQTPEQPNGYSSSKITLEAWLALPDPEDVGWYAPGGGADLARVRQAEKLDKEEAGLIETLFIAEPAEQLAARQAPTPPATTSSPETSRLDVAYSSNSSVVGEAAEDKSVQRGIARKQPAASVTKQDIKASSQVVPSKTAASPVPEQVKDSARKPAKMPGLDSKNIEDDVSQADDKLIVKFKIPKSKRNTVNQILRLRQQPQPSRTATPSGRDMFKELFGARKTASPSVNANKITTTDKTTPSIKSTKLEVPPLKRQTSDTSTARRTPQPQSNAPSSSPAPISARPPATRQPTPQPVKTAPPRNPLVRQHSSSLLSTMTLPSTPASSAIIADTPSSTGFAASSPAVSTTTTSNLVSDAAKAKHKAEADRLRAIAIELKARNKNSPSTSWDALTALTAIEALLAFMKCFLLLDQTLPVSRRGALPAFGKWTTMVLFGEAIAKQCVPFLHLQGLARCLQSVVNATVVACGARGGVGREGRAEAIKKEIETKKTTAVGTPEAMAKAEMDTLLNAATATHVLGAEAATLLPLELMRKEYPQAAKEMERGLRLGGAGMSPTAAVKMAFLMLGEWARKNQSENSVKDWKRTLTKEDVGL